MPTMIWTVALLLLPLAAVAARPGGFRPHRADTDHDARLLACTWRGGDGVMAENAPPRAATLTGAFPARETRGVTYTLSHPDYLFGQTSYGQTVRFCPKPPDPDPEESDPPWCSAGEGDASDGSDDDRDEHWCCHWGACSRWCICECTCGGVPDEPLPGEEGLDEACPEHSAPYADCVPLHEDDYTNAVQRVPRLDGIPALSFAAGANPFVNGQGSSMSI